MSMRAPPSPLSPSARALSGDLEAARRVVHGALAVLFVAAAAQLAVPIPVTPVPVSLQDLAVLLVGVVLGPAAGASALVAYVFVGALGAPVFSNGHAGLPWLLGPTGGYLLAYPAAAWVMGMTERMSRVATAPGDGVTPRPSWALRLAGILVGALGAQLVVYAGGVGQLTLLTGQDVGMAVTLGVVPFLPGVAVKMGMLAAFVVGLDRFGPHSLRPAEWSSDEPDDGADAA
jgi:biotin transport system substrate-specific component